MAKVHIAISDTKLAPELIAPISAQFSVKQWDSPDQMLQSPEIQPGDVAIVGEDWAQDHKKTLGGKPFPRFIVMLDQGKPQHTPGELAKTALKWMEAGAVECLTPLGAPKEVRGVIDFVLYQGNHQKTSAEKFRGLWMILSFSLVLIVLALFASLFQKNSPLMTPDMPKKEKFYHVLTPSPYGIAIDGRQVWISDLYSKSITSYYIQGDLALQNRFTFNGFSPAAITNAPHGLWSLGNDQRLRMHAYDETFSVLHTFDLGPEKFSGLSWDGESLWSGLVNTSEIVRFEFEEDQVKIAERYPTSAQWLVGLVVRDKKVWVLDGKSGEILGYKKSPEGIEIDRRLGLSYFAEGMNQPAGFGGDGQTLWVTADKSGLVYSLKL